MPRSHETVIQETLDYMRSHLSESLDLTFIASRMRCSKSWLQKIFPKYTGKGPIAHLLELRLEKAKELLRSTRMNVLEIATSCGFNSHAYFGIAFRKAYGISPSEFRRQNSAIQNQSAACSNAKVPQVWFSDSLASDAIGSRWQPVEGDWLQETGCIAGQSDGNVNLALKRLLPDNFRLTFEFRL